MKNLILSIFSLLLVCPLVLQSQNWDKDFDKEVNFIKMTEAGVAVVGTDDALYGINSEGKVLWQNEKLKKVEENRVEVLTGSELIFVSDKGLLARNRAINVLNGAEYADSNIKGDNILGAAIAHPANMLFVMKSPKSFDAWDIKSNKMLWSIGGEIPFGISTEQMASLTATFRGMQPFVYTSNSSAIMHLGLGNLADYNLNTGQPNWQFDFRPYKLKKPGNGKGDKPSNPSKGYAVMKLDNKSNTLYFPFRDILIAVDAKSGRAKWDVKANKIGQVRDLHVVPEGILVLNLNGLQLIDPATGAEKWDKPLKVKGAESGLLVQDGDLFYMVSKKYLMEIDVAKKSAKQLTDKIKFEGNESFSSIEMKDDLIILGSSQNIVGINKKSGNIEYQKYFKAPGASLTTIAQNVTLATVAAAATMNSQRIGQQNANADGSYTYHQYTPAVMSSGTRNSSNADNFKYINTKFKGKGFGLAKVDKNTGKLSNEIVIGDRSPIYATDENANLIYYKADKKKVACMTMK